MTPKIAFDRTSAPQGTKFYRSLDAINAFRLRVTLKYLGAGGENRPPQEELTVRWQEKVLSPRELLHYANLGNIQHSMLELKLHETAKGVAASRNRPEGLWLASGGDVLQAPWTLYTAIDGESALAASAGNAAADAAEDEPIVRDYDEPEDPAAPSSLAATLVGQVVACLGTSDPSSPNKGNHNPKDNLVTAQRATGLSRERLVRAASATTQMQIRCAFRVVDPQTGFTEIVDVRLCSLKAYSFGLLQMQPGLSSDYREKSASTESILFDNATDDRPSTEAAMQPFRITIAGVDAYELYIENVSDTLTATEEKQEWDVYTEFLARQLAQRDVAEGLPFATAPFKVASARPGLHCAVFGSAQTACGFATTASLALRWSVLLPDDWFISAASLDSAASTAGDSEYSGIDPASSNSTPDGQAVLMGWTQIAFRGRNNSNELAFAAPLSFEVRTPYDAPVSWPTLLVEAFAVDAFPTNPARVTALGAGAVPLILETPGPRTVVVPCWRPVGSPREEMRRWFLGDAAGSTAFADARVAVGPVSTWPVGAAASGRLGFQPRVLNKLGQRAETVGSVTFSFQTVLRRVAVVAGVTSGDGTLPASPASVPTSPNSALPADGKAVVQALNRARLRLKQIRSEIDRELSLG